MGVENHHEGAGMAMIRAARTLAILLLTTGCGDDTSTCSLNEPCPVGSFCEAGECVSECDPVAQACTVGLCTQDGRCARDQPDPDAGVCAAMVLEAEFGTPTVVLLVDQSGSMTAAYSGGNRWDVLRDALIDPTNGVVTRRQDVMRFGLTLYTNNGGPTCPDLTTVDPALNNRDAIATVYQAEQPEADTPTGESIDAVAQALANFPEAGPRYIILATDGEPDTCAVPNPQNGQPESVAAAEVAFAAGIKLFILSVGTGTVSLQHMQDVANAGIGLTVGGAENAPFWEAGDATQLAEAFDAITGALLTCDLTVNGVIEPEAIESGVIYLDGNRLDIDTADGWEPIDDTSFRLLGDACTRAKRAGGHTVTAEFGCEASEPAELSAEGGGAIDPGCAATSKPLFAAVLLVGGFLALGRRRRYDQRP